MGFDLHGNKLPVAVILATLAICAFFTARGSTNLLAAKLLPLDGSVGKPAAADGKPTALPGSQPPNMTAILARNIFDPETGPLPKKELPPEPTGEPTEEGEELLPGQMPPPCEGSVKLVASVHSERAPEWSFASLDVGSGEPLLYREGSQVDGKEVANIYPKAVFLKQGGSLCSVTMFAQQPATPAKAARRTAKKEDDDDKPAPTPSRKGQLPEDELDKSIQKVSDTKYTVNRDLIDKVLANQAELMRSARIVPHEQNGQVVGVKLYGIRRKSLLGKLGMQNGDLLRTINGYDMSSPDTALEAYTRLRSASNLTVSVTRRGRALNLEYQVQE